MRCRKASASCRQRGLVSCRRPGSTVARCAPPALQNSHNRCCIRAGGAWSLFFSCYMYTNSTLHGRSPYSNAPPPPPPQGLRGCQNCQNCQSPELTARGEDPHACSLAYLTLPCNMSPRLASALGPASALQCSADPHNTVNGRGSHQGSRPAGTLANLSALYQVLWVPYTCYTCYTYHARHSHHTYTVIWREQRETQTQTD